MGEKDTVARMIGIVALVAVVVVAALLGVTFQGTHGITGSVGSIGPPGSTGPQGPSGQNGHNGTNGANGSNGENGANGTDGKNGVNTTGVPYPTLSENFVLGSKDSTYPLPNLTIGWACWWVSSEPGANYCLLNLTDNSSVTATVGGLNFTASGDGLVQYVGANPTLGYIDANSNGSAIFALWFQTYPSESVNGDVTITPNVAIHVTLWVR
jgi:hypothetical protein